MSRLGFRVYTKQNTNIALQCTVGFRSLKVQRQPVLRVEPGSKFQVLCSHGVAFSRSVIYCLSFQICSENIPAKSNEVKSTHKAHYILKN